MVLFAVVGVDPPSEGTEGQSGQEEEEFAEASLTIAGYCEDFGEIALGDDLSELETLEDQTPEALAAVETVAEITRENPNAEYMGEPLSADVEQTVAAMRDAGAAYPNSGGSCEQPLNRVQPAKAH